MSLLVSVSVCGVGVDVDGGCTPLPTRPERYRDPASLVTRNGYSGQKIPVMAAVAVRKKVVSIGHFYLYSLQSFLLVR